MIPEGREVNEETPQPAYCPELPGPEKAGGSPVRGRGWSRKARAARVTGTDVLARSGLRPGTGQHMQVRPEQELQKDRAIPEAHARPDGACSASHSGKPSSRGTDYPDGSASAVGNSALDHMLLWSRLTKKGSGTASQNKAQEYL